MAPDADATAGPPQGWHDLEAVLAEEPVARLLAAYLARLRADAVPVLPEQLGVVGKEFRPEWPGYARKTGATTTQAGASIPYVVEAWATCSRPVQKGQGDVQVELLMNRSMTV